MSEVIDISRNDSEKMMELGQAQGRLDLDIPSEPRYHIFTHVT